MLKIFTWLKVNVASLLAGAQLIIKILKELLTAIVNVLSIFFPAVAAEKLVLAIRTGLNLIDDAITKIKDLLIPLVA
jgi:hypothetical protein